MNGIFRGILSEGGICPYITTIYGEIYSLHGEIPPELYGRFVEVRGETVISFCMIGQAVRIDSIVALPFFWLDRTYQVVSEINEVRVIEKRTNPASYAISVSGTDPTTGWSRHKVIKTKVLPNGHAIFVVVASPPHGAERVLTSFGPIEHDETLPEPPIASMSFLSLNKVIHWPKDLEDDAVLRGGGNPWPWNTWLTGLAEMVLPARMESPRRAAAPDPLLSPTIKELIGKRLRVLPPGTMGDTQYDRERVTLHTDAAGRITSVSFG